MLSSIGRPVPQIFNERKSKMKIDRVSVRYEELRSTGYPNFSNVKVGIELGAILETGETAAACKARLLELAKKEVKRELGDKLMDAQNELGPDEFKKHAVEVKTLSRRNQRKLDQYGHIVITGRMRCPCGSGKRFKSCCLKGGVLEK